MATKRAIVIGAGVAGLATAHELVSATDVQPLVYEAQNDVGGLAKTVVYRGNRIDIGPHRFFSKSDEVNDWWQGFLPVSTTSPRDLMPVEDKVMMICPRLTRILSRNGFFDYPISLDAKTLLRLGPLHVVMMGLSYCGARLRPSKEKTLEDFFVNRFGRVLYRKFFKDYTEKIWGVPCAQISPEWGSQRIKGLSIAKVLSHCLGIRTACRDSSIGQKSTETSLIGRFLYPKLGSGQMWEEVARGITAKGGRIFCNRRVISLISSGSSIAAVDVFDTKSGKTERVEGDYVVSTMPVVDLVTALGEAVPGDVQRIAQGLAYRDHVMVGLLVTQMRPMEHQSMKTHPCRLPDNWIYIHDTRVRAGRLQIVNNWSPAMLRDPETVWLGLEYFCTAGDSLWRMSDADITRLAAEELSRLKLIDLDHVLDATVVRTTKAYPGYFGTYRLFESIRGFLDSYENLLLVGRNGMHRYNNMDHSVLSGLMAARSIAEGNGSRQDLWDVNTEQSYHEAKVRAQ